MMDPADSAPSGAGQRMCEALRHRGPDGEGVVQIGPATLAHTRLAIIDPAGGEQPLYSEDGQITAIVNGEIYNHLDLRAELEQAGHVFATGSDSEVVVHGYEEHGADFVRRMNGIFAFALYDERRERLLAVRDPFGVKPLYWHSDGTRTAMASEVGRADRRRAGDPRAGPGGAGPLPGLPLRARAAHPVRRRQQAARGEHAGGRGGLGAEGDSYREAPGDPLDVKGRDLEGELAERFTDAVERQMMSDVPYGAFLSGGVDSAAIVAAMARRSERPPMTFTIGFPGHGDVLDERRYARETAATLGTDHHETAMAEGDFLGELERCVRRLEEPVGLPSAGALMQLSRFAAESVKVVLSGQGADEPHGGYGRHQAAAALGAAGIAGRAAGPLGSLAARVAGGNERVRRASRLLGDLEPADRLVRLLEITGDDLRTELTGTSGEEAAAERRARADAVLADVGDRGLVEQALYLDTHLHLPDSLLICADKMSMSASLEQRVPFLDVELMRFVERVPARERVRIRDGKRLHRKAMGRLVPREVVDRPKHGFSTPYEDWLRTSLGEEVARRYSPGSQLGDLIDPGTVGRLVEEHRSSRSDHKSLLYCLLELSDWHQAFVQPREPVHTSS